MTTGQTAGEGPAAPPLSERVCGLAAVVFAVWTVCAHATVALGGNLHQLLAAFAAALLLLAVAGSAVARRGPRPAVPPPPIPPARPRALWWLQALGGAIACVLAALAVRGGDEHLVRSWWSAVILLGAAAVPFLCLEAPLWVPAVRGRGVEAVLWLLAAACVVIALVVHRPDLDDGFYVNVAVAAADSPDAALLAHDTMLGVPGLPLHQPAHRIHTYELWNGALAYLSGIPPIYVFHWLSAACFALLVPLTHARLFRQLTPRIWPWTVAALLLVLTAVGETHRWYGNFALVRIWQGKAIYLCVFMPLVYASAIEFALRPSASRWGLLWAAQTAAVGCSSTAVWAAPVGAFVALASCVRPNPAGLRRFALGALASVYVLAVGLALKGDVQPQLAPLIQRFAFGAQLGNALRQVLGSGHVFSAGLVSVFVAWAVSPRGLAQRFAIAAPLAVWLVLLSPYWDHWVSANLTGPSFWRSLWSLPLPILMALVLVAPLHGARGGGRRRAAAVAACVAGAAACVAWVPAYSVFSDRNGGAAGVGIHIGMPRVKAPEEAYRWAQALNAAVPPGAVVVAPPDVSVWIATFPHHAYPLQTRKLYLSHHVDQLGVDQVNLRIFMSQYVGGGGQANNPHAHFARGLRTLDVKGVLLRNSDRAVTTRRILARAGFERSRRALDYEIWVRP